MNPLECIQRKNGKTLTRKEVIDYFQQLFGIEIKAPEGKLNRATNRKTNTTPFLDSLKVAFDNYGLKKEEKQRVRK
ncbi:MAG TPA: RteC domain-containing protein [Paludibacter sp.]